MRCMDAQMLQTQLQNKFNYNEPIFTDELLKAFPDKSRPQVFRYIEQAKEQDILSQYDTGIYYMPTQSILGKSIITSEEIATKKYIKNDQDVYGVFGGLTLLNIFHSTTQVPATIEIISNKESSKKRTIYFKNRKYIVKKSRCKITKDNFAIYTILELFNSFKLNEKIPKITVETAVEYFKKENIKIFDLTMMSKYFPSKAVKNLMRSGVIYEVVRE